MTSFSPPCPPPPPVPTLGTDGAACFSLKANGSVFLQTRLGAGKVAQLPVECRGQAHLFARKPPSKHPAGPQQVGRLPGGEKPQVGLAFYADEGWDFFCGLVWVAARRDMRLEERT